MMGQDRGGSGDDARTDEQASNERRTKTQEKNRRAQQAFRFRQKVRCVKRYEQTPQSRQ